MAGNSSNNDTIGKPPPGSAAALEADFRRNLANLKPSERQYSYQDLMNARGYIEAQALKEQLGISPDAPYGSLFNASASAAQAPPRPSSQDNLTAFNDQASPEDSESGYGTEILLGSAALAAIGGGVYARKKYLERTNPVVADRQKILKAGKRVAAARKRLEQTNKELDADRKRLKDLDDNLLDKDGRLDQKKVAEAKKLKSTIKQTENKVKAHKEALENAKRKQKEVREHGKTQTENAEKQATKKGPKIKKNLVTIKGELEEIKDQKREIQKQIEETKKKLEDTSGKSGATDPEKIEQGKKLDQKLKGLEKDKTAADKKWKSKKKQWKKALGEWNELQNRTTRSMVNNDPVKHPTTIPKATPTAAAVVPNSAEPLGPHRPAPTATTVPEPTTATPKPAPTAAALPDPATVAAQPSAGAAETDGGGTSKKKKKSKKKSKKKKFNKAVEKAVTEKLETPEAKQAREQLEATKENTKAVKKNTKAVKNANKVPGTAAAAAANPADGPDGTKAAEVDAPETAKPIVDPEAKPTVDPEAKPIVDPEAKPTVDPEAKPIVDPEAKPIVDPANPTEAPKAENRISKEKFKNNVKLKGAKVLSLAFAASAGITSLVTGGSIDEATEATLATAIPYYDTYQAWKSGDITTALKTGAAETAGLVGTIAAGAAAVAIAPVAGVTLVAVGTVGGLASYWGVSELADAVFDDDNQNTNLSGTSTEESTKLPPARLSPTFQGEASHTSNPGQPEGGTITTTFGENAGAPQQQRNFPVSDPNMDIGLMLYIAAAEAVLQAPAPTTPYAPPGARP